MVIIRYIIAEVGAIKFNNKSMKQAIIAFVVVKVRLKIIIMEIIIVVVVFVIKIEVVE